MSLFIGFPILFVISPKAFMRSAFTLPIPLIFFKEFNDISWINLKLLFSVSFSFKIRCAREIDVSSFVPLPIIIDKSSELESELSP